MQIIRILAWQRIPYAPDETPGMPTYRLAGTVEGVNTPGPRGTVSRRRRAWPIIPRTFIADVACEIDGRDCEYMHVAGYDVGADPVAWDNLLDAMMSCDSLKAEMEAEAARYHASVVPPI